MPHHVPVGVIAEDEVVLLRLDRVAEDVGDAGSTHFRHQIVGGDFLGGDEDALFAGIRGLDAAIEEVGDVGVLLRLGGAEHRLAALREDLGDDARQHRRPERDREREGLVVLGHGREPDPWPPPRVEAVELCERERAHDLAHPGGAEVDAEDAVPVLDPWGARHDPRLHELVRLARLVGLPHRAHGVGRGLADPVHHRVVGDLGPLPALVAVHRVVAAHDRGDRDPAPVLGEEVDELLHEGAPGLGRRVPAVEPGVDRHGQLVQVPEHDRRDEVVVERVHAAVADQAEQMEGMSGAPQLAAQLDQRGDVEEGAGIDRLRNAHNVLRHDTTGAEVQMPDLAVADLPFGESHGESGRVEQRARRLRPEAMPGGRPAELDRVPHLAGKRLARVALGAVVAGGDIKGEWIGVTLEGWIFGTSVGVTPRAGFDLAVTRAPEENLRAAPGGTIIAKLADGFLLTKLGENGAWVHVERRGWVRRVALEPVVVANSRTAESDTSRAGSPPARRSGGADTPRPAPGPNRAPPAPRPPPYPAPDGPPAGTLTPATPLKVLSKSGEWARVQFEGWGQTSDLESAPPGVLVGVSAAELRAEPQRFAGQTLRWTLQFIAVQQADELRPEMPKGAIYFLARGPLPERGFVYVIVPEGKRALVEGLAPLATIQVTARVRAGRSRFLGNPVLDLLSLEPQS